MTAEEVALDQFRSAVILVRVARKSGRDSLGYLTAVYMLARIIRAIRAEDRGDRMRASYEASVSEQVIHAETAWYDRGYEQGYAEGRRDALREAIDLCQRTEAGDTNHDWREAAKCCRELIESLAAQAAEEAAR